MTAEDAAEKSERETKVPPEPKKNFIQKTIFNFCEAIVMIFQFIYILYALYWGKQNKSINRTDKLLKELKNDCEAMNEFQVNFDATSSVVLTATITGPRGTPYGYKSYSISINCDNEYPESPPTFKFITKVAMEGVDRDTGSLLPEQWGTLRNWNKSYMIKNVLEDIRMNMMAEKNSKLQQPAEGAMY